MISYGDVDLQFPGAEESAWIESKIPMREAFGFIRPRWLGDTAMPREQFGWATSRPFRINCLFHPWGASRFGFAFVLADGNMRDAIAAQNAAGVALPLVIDDGVGSFISTYMYQLPAVPLSKILVEPQLPLHLLPLVDQRYRWWECAGSVAVTEGTTTWASVYSQIAAALGITITVDPISTNYLWPGNGLTKAYQHMPLLLDLVAASVGQRICLTLAGSIFARNAATSLALTVAQANLFAKYAGGSLDLGVVNA